MTIEKKNRNSGVSHSLDFSIRKLNQNCKWFQTQIPRTSTGNRGKTNAGLEKAVPVQGFKMLLKWDLICIRITTRIIHYLEEVRAISETKKKNSCRLHWTPEEKCFTACILLPQVWTEPPQGNQLSPGRSPLERVVQAQSTVVLPQPEESSLMLWDVSQLRESFSISIGVILFLDLNSTEMMTAGVWFCYTAISGI